MRVLCIMNHADEGGAALAFIELVERLHADFGVDCVVLTGRRNGINERCEGLGIESHSFPFKNFISHSKEPEALWRVLLRARHFLGNRAALREIERSVDVDGVDLVYSSLDRIDIGAILAERHGKPHVWHLREHLDTDFKTLSIYPDYVKYMLSFPSRYVAVSDSVRDTWLGRGLRPRDGIATVYDGVDCGHVRRKTAWFRGGKVNFLFLGGYADLKGQRAFLDVVQRLEPSLVARMSVTFYGQGDFGPVRDSIRRDDVRAAVEFNGYRPDVYDLIADYDVGVNYSSSEGFGRVTVEYMAAGLVPLVSASGASPEIVRDGADGYVADRRDADAARGVLEAVIRGRESLPAMGARAAERARAFSMDSHVRRMHELFGEVVGHD